MVGKIRLVKMPWINHSWHVTLYVSPRGLTTGSIPFEDGSFTIEFDFISHQLIIRSSTNKEQRIELFQRTVANFYKELFQKLSLMGIEVKIYAKPNELEPAIPFEKDDLHFQYDKEQINLYWQSMVNIQPGFI